VLRFVPEAPSKPANTLRMLVFALPAGALTDIVDRRRLLITGEAANTILPA